MVEWAAALRVVYFPFFLLNVVCDCVGGCAGLVSLPATPLFASMPCGWGLLILFRAATWSSAKLSYSIFSRPLFFFFWIDVPTNASLHLF